VPGNIRWATKRLQALNKRKAATWRNKIYEDYTIIQRRNKT